MPMLTAVQWNIGGALIRDPDSNPIEPSSYTLENLDYIVGTLKSVNADVITLQETHCTPEESQAEAIAERLGFNYWINDGYDESHLNPTYKLSQSIISRHKIDEPAFDIFYNPKFTTIWDGQEVVSHAKGLTSCKMTTADKTVAILTLHAMPFRVFNVDPLSEETKEVREDMQRKILAKQAGTYILQGDFNYDGTSIFELLPELALTGAVEAPKEKPTTPRGKNYDHVVFNNLHLVSSQVIDTVLTDHYPIISTFEL